MVSTYLIKLFFLFAFFEGTMVNAKQAPAEKCSQLLQNGLSKLGDTVPKVINSSSDFINSIDAVNRSNSIHEIAEMNITLNKDNDTEIRQCSSLFDDLLCWSDTDAPDTVNIVCPPALLMGYANLTEKNLKITEIASKVCLSNGEWYKNLNGVLCGNYTLCTPHYGIDGVNELNDTRKCEEAMKSYLLNKWLPIIKVISQIGYSTSFTTLVIAMVVFSLLRRLRNPRNRLHMHLFASFIMRAFMALLKDWIFVDGIKLTWDFVPVEGNNIVIKGTCICKVITSLWQYFIMANYSWILMEGLYLHNLIFLALCTDTSTISLYVLLGWGLPILVVVPWIIGRAIMEDTLCWTTHWNQSLFLIIQIPTIISMLLNFLLFLNIVRVLLVKLKTSVHLQRKKMQYKKWAKSTLVLVPLFGTHYTIFQGLSYPKDYKIKLIWLFCDQLFASFQGAFVALIYCLLNGEVRAEIKRAWNSRLSKRDIDQFIFNHRQLSKSLRHKRYREQRRSKSGSGFAMIESSMPLTNKIE